METAEEIRKVVVEIMELLPPSMADCDKKILAEKLGFVVNLAVRACPRGVQHTVRRNIVSKAVQDYCYVSMSEVEDNGRTFHKISISSK
jgi:hypothetical protein